MNTKRKKLAVAVLILAVAAFAVDRLWLSGGDEPPSTVARADAAPASKAGPAPAPGKPAAATMSPTVKLESLLAGRLKQLAARQGGGQEVRDAFQPSIQWVPPKQAQAPKTPQAEPVAEVDPLATFTHRNKLTAVLVGSTGGGAAVVGNTLMREGQKLDGFRLTEIRRTSVVFTAGDGRTAVLALDGAHGESQGN